MKHTSFSAKVKPAYVIAPVALAIMLLGASPAHAGFFSNLKARLFGSEPKKTITYHGNNIVDRLEDRLIELDEVAEETSERIDALYNSGKDVTLPLEKFEEASAKLNEAKVSVQIVRDALSTNEDIVNEDGTVITANEYVRITLKTAEEDVREAGAELNDVKKYLRESSLKNRRFFNSEFKMKNGKISTTTEEIPSNSSDDANDSDE